MTRATRPAFPHSRRATCLPAIAGAYAAPRAGIGTDRLHTRLAWRQARRHYWVAVTERTEAAVERARSTLAATPAARRPYGRIGAFLVTALLMLASFFTITSILASADLAPLEAWLLPVAFGPVFVLATKIAVGAWLSSAPADRLPSPTHHLMSWLVGPCLACASLALVGGVALKSVAVGALMPLQNGISQLSSVLIFAGLALGELAGAAALAARQHRPGREPTVRLAISTAGRYGFTSSLRRGSGLPTVEPLLPSVRSACIRSGRRDVPGLRWLRVGRGPLVTAGMVTRSSVGWRSLASPSRTMTVEHPPGCHPGGTPLGILGRRTAHRPADCSPILPVLIALNLLLYLVILPTAVEAIIG